jgi:orotate phosphoribosyltransferase
MFLRLFEESGALLTGHFILTSGNHSDRYFEKFDVLNQPSHVETLCRALAEKLRETKPDVVLGPTTLGILLAYEVAKHLGFLPPTGKRARTGSGSCAARSTSNRSAGGCRG